MTLSTNFGLESSEYGDSPLKSRLASLLQDLRDDLLALSLPGESGEGTGAEFERGVSAALNKMGRGVMGAAIEAVDPSEDQLLLDGMLHYRVGPSRGRMMTSFGAVEFARSRFRRRKLESVFPAEARFGLLAGFWTPLAAEQGTLALSLLPMEDSRAVLQRLGGMEVSGTALNHLLATSEAAWDVLRDGALKEAREAEGVPKDAALLVVSMDGTMIGMRQGKAPPGQEDGARPAGYREASSGTISFYSREGKCLRTVRYGRMPEARKLSLKADLLTEVAHYLELQPDLELMFIADGASENWAWCEEVFPNALQLLDYWHALVHLKDALDAAYGEGSKPGEETLSEAAQDPEAGGWLPACASRAAASREPLSRPQEDPRRAAVLPHTRRQDGLRGRKAAWGSHRQRQRRVEQQVDLQDAHEGTRHALVGPRYRTGDRHLPRPLEVRTLRSRMERNRRCPGTSGVQIPQSSKHNILIQANAMATLRQGKFAPVAWSPPRARSGSCEGWVY